MILSKEDMTEIFKENPRRKVIAKGMVYNKLLRKHLYGDGLEQSISRINGYETLAQGQVRAKYSTSNKDLFGRLGRPIDKVFSAKGGSVYYNTVDEEKARELGKNVRNGYSIKKWIELFWKPHMLDDPFGLVFMEILPEAEAVQAKKAGRSICYPTYKPITQIFDYLVHGDKVEYVIFLVGENEKIKAGLSYDKVYRVVDDAFDYWVGVSQGTPEIIQNMSYPNYFMRVPALVNSDLIDPNNEGCFLSLYDEVIEQAEKFLLKGSIKAIHEFKHGFPKYWEYVDDCINCNGSGFKEAAECKVCFGTGKKMMLSVEDSKLLTHPGKDEAIIAPNVAGYVSPDKTFWEIATADLQMLEDVMNITLWGMQTKIKIPGLSQVDSSHPATATEILAEIKPQADRLNSISEMAEKRHRFILDSVIMLNMSQGYRGSSVNYGRRYMLEGPDSVWMKYSDARQRGAPQNVLDTLLNEYYEANYESDPVGLALAKKLIYVEPFVHYTAQQVKELEPGEEDYKGKLYFGEWLSLQNDAIILSMSVEELKESLRVYVSTKSLKPVKLIAA